MYTLKIDIMAMLVIAVILGITLTMSLRPEIEMASNGVNLSDNDRSSQRVRLSEQESTPTQAPMYRKDAKFIIVPATQTPEIETKVNFSPSTESKI
jgi:quinol-cytochrome oxidoreductase complex cytochrome b subunit